MMWASNMAADVHAFPQVVWMIEPVKNAVAHEPQEPPYSLYTIWIYTYYWNLIDDSTMLGNRRHNLQHVRALNVRPCSQCRDAVATASSAGFVISATNTALRYLLP